VKLPTKKKNSIKKLKHSASMSLVEVGHGYCKVIETMSLKCNHVTDSNIFVIKCPGTVQDSKLWRNPLCHSLDWNLVLSHGAQNCLQNNFFIQEFNILTTYVFWLLDMLIMSE
jgi:hypothetical protein